MIQMASSRWHTMKCFILVMVIVASAIACLGCTDSPGKERGTKDELPEISAFLTKPSDRFLADIKEVTNGHPFLGVDSPRPHAGGHVHFDNTECLAEGERRTQ